MGSHAKRPECVARSRYALRVRGTVQGVGFRPAVHRLARALGLAGFVRNDEEGVAIEVEGAPVAVAEFLRALRSLPSPVRVESVEETPIDPRGERSFRIVQSAPSERADSVLALRAAIPPDLAPCAACLRELSDENDRRYRYPFINCTACGPRYTIVRSVPYDRARTTMADFVLCAACRREYEDPADRRFHAEPNACGACGPRLTWTLGAPAPATRAMADEARRLVGQPAQIVGEAALAAAVRALHAGSIVAIKGAGGFFLACDASDEEAVARLRVRKRRPHQPFAVMARSIEDAARIALVDEVAALALLSPARPIVLLLARPAGGATGAVTRMACGALAGGVAPSLREVGVLLPPTPLQHLLALEGPPLLVMTSGNRRGEPIARDNAEALFRLADIADGFLLHDRAIHTRADDSVVRIIDGEARTLRRARGFVPASIALPTSSSPAMTTRPGETILAVGGALKNTVCLAHAGQAVLSQHIGDLDDPDALDFFEESIEKLVLLVGARPSVLARDLHPDYPSTRWAIRVAAGAPGEAKQAVVAVQHHHAHIASCLAEHGLVGPVLGVAFDGTGCGLDGTLWGGEFLRADLGGFERLGSLQPIALVGGEAAIREPWRVALAALVAAGEPQEVIDALLGGVDPARRRRVRWLLDHAPPVAQATLATGAGRWFDAVAALCGLRHEVSYEGQAAIELEAAAAVVAAGSVPPYPFSIEERPGAPFVVDLRPTVRAIAEALGSPARPPGGARGAIVTTASTIASTTVATVATVAARFHETLAQLIAAACARARGLAGSTVALSGGCFGNRRLTERAKALLEADGFEVLLHRRVPPGDGGLSLGQAAVAAFRARAATEIQLAKENDACV